MRCGFCRTPPRFEVPSVLIAALRFCRNFGCVIIFCGGRCQSLPVAPFAILEFSPPPADHVSIFGVKFHCFAHSTDLFTGNKCTSGTAESVDDSVTPFRRVLQEVNEHLHRLHCRVNIVPLGFVELNDGRLTAVSVPVVCCSLFPPAIC